jgi:UDP-glucose 4-epimerase
MSKTLLITGGAGYIGSHFIEALYESKPEFLAGVRVVILDDLSSGSQKVVDTLSALAESKGFPKPKLYQVDLLNAEGVAKAFTESKPDAVVHFAAKISVAESVERPDFYFENNVMGSKNLLIAMKSVSCTRIVFSSTAAVYGKVEDAKKASLPLLESTTLKPINPYGKTKLMMEETIQAARSEWKLNSVIFRYFNAAGASFSGRLGECHEPETHLVPLLVRSVLKNDELKVFGTNYETRDGSCIRDYIHVADLASAHLLGLKHLFENETLAKIYNLGTARGSSVLEVIDAASVITGKTVKTRIMPARAGDSGTLVADSTKARTELGWAPAHSSLHDILKSVIAWESKHT